MSNHSVLRWFLILADLKNVKSEFMFKMALEDEPKLSEKQNEAIEKMVTGFHMGERVDKFVTENYMPFLADELEHEDEKCYHSGEPITDAMSCVLDRAKQAYLSVEAFKTLNRKVFEKKTVVKKKKSAKLVKEEN